MTFVNPDNPNNISTIEEFDVIGISGDATEDQIFINFISNDPDNPGQHTLEGSLLVKNFEQLKSLSGMLSKAVEDIEKKIGH
jgi:hypothetical protein